jgi:DNA-binding NtrC family response regulator
MAIDHFREDLFHRIATVQIELPPMRDRPEDVPLLVGHFLENSGVEVSVFAMERMIGHRWPGNVRELKNTLAGAIAAARSRESHEIQVEDVDDLSEPLSVRREDASDEQQKARIVAALEASAGNVSQAARDLGMRRARIYELLTALAIDPAEFRRR